MLWDCKVQSKKAELEEDMGKCKQRRTERPWEFMGFLVNVHLLYRDLNLLL